MKYVSHLFRYRLRFVVSRKYITFDYKENNLHEEELIGLRRRRRSQQQFELLLSLVASPGRRLLAGRGGPLLRVRRIPIWAPRAQHRKAQKAQADTWRKNQDSWTCRLWEWHPGSLCSVHILQLEWYGRWFEKVEFTVQPKGTSVEYELNAWLRSAGKTIYIRDASYYTKLDYFVLLLRWGNIVR